MEWVVTFGILLAVAAYGARLWMGVPRREIVYDTETVLLFQAGRYIRTLAPGGYWIWPKRDRVVRFDMRQQSMEVPGQEVLTSDMVAIKLSLVVRYAWSDPVKAYRAAPAPYTVIYQAAQLALRDVVGGRSLDDILADRAGIGAAMQEPLAQAFAEAGATLDEVVVRDVMLPAALKRGQMAVLEAKLEAQAQLETARGEQAVLRSLANSARMMETTPGLYRARLLQELRAGRHTIVIDDKGQAATAAEPPEA